jgi:hypothetical protein
MIFKKEAKINKIVENKSFSLKKRYEPIIISIRDNANAFKVVKVKINAGDNTKINSTKKDSSFDISNFFNNK